ncbi:MAG: YggS family pyridoxal phosphate-dependent enzyme [Desulfovibrio sp.]|nr:YggS family pyridoxal phosphate-dependent enzyme [Desulfovibrio sp.]
MQVKAQIVSAAKESGRSPDDVRLLAVSKYHPVESMLTLLGVSDCVFGENYVQEAIGKQVVLAKNGFDPRAAVHMIGHIQSKKASQVAGRFSMIHSLDSQKLALALEKKLVSAEVEQPVLIEVNIGDEIQKNGVCARDLPAFADYVLEKCPHLRLEGLMCLPPAVDNGEDVRPFFARLRELCEGLRTRLDLPLPELSMGMSGDFTEAIREGATFVRIGTAIFGPRPLVKPAL